MNKNIEYIKKANSLLEKAYVPYSKFPVAAVLIDEDGKEYYGVNVENSSYGLALCAERNAITSAVTLGLKKIKEIYVTAKTDRPVSPCGACRQVIAEFSERDTKIVLGTEKSEDYLEYTLEEIIPYYFVPGDLDI